MKPKLLVIIVTFNAMRWIDRCISSLLNSDYPVDIYIIDNGSTDGTQNYINNYYKKVIFVQNSANEGFGAANNKGIIYAIKHGYQYIYLLNQDAWVDSNVFEELIKVKEHHPEYGILSPLQLTGDGTQLDKNFLFNIKEKRCHRLLKDIEKKQVKDVYTTEFVMAAHWLLAVDDLKKVGLFSPAFRHYGEDGNLVARYKYWGYKIGVCPKAKAYHDRQYRVVEPEKQLYLWYTSFLSAINNPLRKNLLKPILKYLYNLVLFTSVDFLTRWIWFIKGMKEIKEGNRYKKEYKREGYMLNNENPMQENFSSKL